MTENPQADANAPGVNADALPAGAAIVDVRRAAAFAASDALIEGATWRDPECVDAWGREWAGRAVVVYCVHGHEVGRAAAVRLRELGVDAHYLVGGFEGWKASGLPLRSKESP